MNTSRHNVEKTKEACNLSFNSMKDFIKHTLKNEHKTIRTLFKSAKPLRR